MRLRTNTNQKEKTVAVLTILLLLKDKELNQTEIKGQINKLSGKRRVLIENLENEKLKPRMLASDYGTEMIKIVNEANSNVIPSILFNPKNIDFGTMNEFGSLLFYEWGLREVNDTLISRVNKSLENAQIIKRERQDGKRGASQKVCSLKRDPIAFLNILLLINQLSWGELRTPSRIKKYFIDSDYGKSIVNTKSIENWFEYMDMRFSKDEKSHVIGILKIFPTALETFLRGVKQKKDILTWQGETPLDDTPYFERGIDIPGFEGFHDPDMFFDDQKVGKIWINNKKQFFGKLLLDAGKDIRTLYSYPTYDDILNDECDLRNFYPKNPPCSYKIVIDWSDKSKKDKREYDISPDKIEVSF